MGISLNSGAFNITDRLGNTKFSLDKRMPHILYNTPGVISIPKVLALSPTAKYVDRSDEFILINNSLINTDDYFVMPFYKVNGGVADSGSSVISGSGSVMVREIIQPSTGLYLGSSIITTIVEPGILKTKDKTVLVSGSVNNLAVEFNKLKKTTKDPIEVITLDNGSYNLGLRTYDKKLTSKDLKSHDLQNRGGGNFIYLKGYAQENYQTPNIRTKEDESYKKGHPLVNEAKAIVLHHTAYEEPTLDNVHKAFMTPKGNSSHVVINYDGSRIKYAEPEQVTFHAGESKFMNRDNVNDFSIGVEFQGDTNKKPLTEDQINSAIDYLLPIIKKNRIPINNITTHAIIANERKADINEQEYNRFLDALKKRYYSKR